MFVPKFEINAVGSIRDHSQHSLHGRRHIQNNIEYLCTVTFYSLYFRLKRFFISSKTENYDIILSSFKIVRYCFFYFIFTN